MSNNQPTVHMRHPDYGTSVCGLGGVRTEVEEDVNCSRCERVMESGHFRVPAKKEEVVTVTEKKTERKPAKAGAPKKKANGKELPDCACNCGEKTKGGRFRPGHDARFHAAQKAKENPEKYAPKPKSTGNHRIDTILGAIRHLSKEDVVRLRHLIDERYFGKKAKVAKATGIAVVGAA